MKEQATVEIDGAPATAEQLRAVALDSYGHFTAMQVRNRRVRGIGLHLHRLSAASREMFGTTLDVARVRDHIRHALGEDTADASVRVRVHEAGGRPLVMVTVLPPASMAAGRWKLRSVPYQRSLAHLKHVGDFGQRYYQRLAQASGFDEALLTAPGGIVSEGAITNIGFFDGSGIIWPAAPVLAGITMQLLGPAVTARGLTTRRLQVRAADLTSFATTFVTNARGIAAVGQIDDQVLPVDEDLMRTLGQAYESTAWDDI